MTDYIKRKDAYMIANDIAMMYATEYTKREYGVADRITQEILRLQAADVVEVVRCKDCKHKYVIQAKDRFYKVENRYYTCDYMNCRYDENHYCSFGERADT